MIAFLKRKFYVFINNASTPLERVGSLIVAFTGFYIVLTMLFWNISCTSDKYSLYDYSQRSFIYTRETLIRDYLDPDINFENEIKREVKGLVGYYCPKYSSSFELRVCRNVVSKNYPYSIVNQLSLLDFFSIEKLISNYNYLSRDISADIRSKIVTYGKSIFSGEDGVQYGAPPKLYPEVDNNYFGDSYIDNWHWLFGGWYIYDKQCIDKYYNGESSKNNSSNYLINFNTQKYTFNNDINDKIWYEFEWEGLNNYCLKSKQWHKFHLEKTIKTDIFNYLESSVFDTDKFEITNKHIFILFFIGLLLFDGRFQKICDKFFIWIRFGKK